MNRTINLPAFGILAVAAAAGFWYLGREEGSAPSEPAQEVQAPAAPGTPATSSPPAAAPASETVAGLGIVEPEGGTIELASELPGVITKVHVAEGDWVKTGDVVAELGNGEYKAKVAQGRAQLAIRQADLLRLENGSRQQEIAQAESRVAELRSAVELAEGDFQRATRLRKSGTVSRRALQAADNARVAARQQLDTAAEALSLVREGARVEEMAAARAEVDLAAEQLAEAEAYLAKSFIRTRSDGLVLRLFREAGEAVSTQPATALAEIGDTSKLVVRAQIDEAEIAGLAVGQTAEISAPALGGRRLTGRITRISPRIGTKIVNADTADEKRDARVLDVIVALDPGVSIPVNLRVDVFIDTDTPVAQAGPASEVVAEWVFRK